MGRTAWMALLFLVFLVAPSHLLTDMKLSAYLVYLLWPLSGQSRYTR